LEVAGEAANGDEALALVKQHDYDLALIDLSMPGLSGLDLIRRLKLEKPRLPILVLSMHGERQYAARALKAGASGYLTKDSAGAELLGAIRKVSGGGGPPPAHSSAARRRPADAPPPTALSDREFEVSRQLVAGHSVTEIAAGLHVSVKTVSTHKARILEKMAMGSTAELVRYAMEHRLL